MRPEAKRDVLDALKEAIAAIKTQKFADLHAISDHVLHAIALYQEENIVNLSVSIYALDKILETEKYRAHPEMAAFKKRTLNLLQRAARQVEADNYTGYSQTIKELLKTIASFTKEIKFYIEDILHFARIKKGTKLYEHGLSLGKAAELMGVTKWELMPAIGETAIHEQLPTPRELIKRRIALTEQLFKVRKRKGKK